ncbi:MAG: hypothetical protein FWD73_08615 [Polyangiaceae bacterium]|nr:hypothetical protein [Polyangiaceae bacterium]
MKTLTLDTGALIALEQKRLRMWKVLHRAHELAMVPVVPANVVAEWWRHRSGIREPILASVSVEPLTEMLARLAGEALAKIKFATLNVDAAIVMASASQRGDVVYTSRAKDLAKLQAVFPGVRIISVFSSR